MPLKEELIIYISPKNEHLPHDGEAPCLAGTKGLD